MLSKSQARTFFLGGTITTFLIFLGLSWTTLVNEVPKRTHEENLTADVIAGKHLWEKNNCMGCHSLMGEGVLAIISYTLLNLTGRKLYDKKAGQYAFWLSNIGMLGMTTAFGVAGIAQVYLERKMGMEFGDVQKEIQVHFVVLAICATFFTTGISLFIYQFIKYGRPTDEALEILPAAEIEKQELKLKQITL